MRANPLRQRQHTLTRERIAHTLEELLYRLVIVPLVAFLPAPFAYSVARKRGNWYFRLNSSMREEILYNLECILGNQLSTTEREQIARNYFRRRSCEAIDVMRMARSGRSLTRLVEIRGLEHVEAALAAGKGAIICSAHFGSYNCCFSLLGACGFHVTTVGDWRSSSDSTMSPPQRFLWRVIQEKLLEHHRQRPNIEPEQDRFGAAMRMVEVLRSNELITMAIETPIAPQDCQRGVSVDFLGRQMFLLPGSVDVAKITGSPVLVLVVHRLRDWRHQVVEISPPVPLDGDTTTVFKRFMKILEAPVRQNLAYWDWLANTQKLVDLGLLPAQMQSKGFQR